MEPGGSKPHSQGLSNNPYPEPIQHNSSYDIYYFKVHCSTVFPPRLDLPEGLFPVGLTVKILKAHQPSSILATWPAYLNLLDLITLNVILLHRKLKFVLLFAKKFESLDIILISLII